MNRLSRSRRAPYRGLVLLALAVSPVLSGCSRSAADLPPPDAPVPVRVADVPHESLAPPILGTGLLAPKDEITLGFKIGGVVARVAVDEGDVVKQGDTLASLELREIDAGVARARAAAGRPIVTSPARSGCSRTAWPRASRCRTRRPRRRWRAPRARPRSSTDATP